MTYLTFLFKLFAFFCFFTKLRTHTLYHTILCLSTKKHKNNKIAMCLLSNNIYDYRIVSQGKVSVESIDDSEEAMITDVRIGLKKI